jgi:hypothetical protein
MPRPIFSTFTFTGIPAASAGVGYYTTTQTGAATQISVTHDVNGLDVYLGWLENGLLLVEQTAAGSGNNASNKFTFTVQTGRTSSGPWLTVPLDATVEITANAALQTGARFQGPLSGWLRVVATVTGSPQAQFTAYVIVGG